MAGSEKPKSPSPSFVSTFYKHSHVLTHCRSLWDVALSQLPDEQQRALKSGLILPLRFEDLRSTIEQARENAASRWKITTRHGEIDIRAKFSQIVSWVQKFIEVGDVAVNYDPGHAALPWAALRLVLQVMVNNTSRAAKYIEGVEQVAFYIYDSAVRENLYLVMESCEDCSDLRNHILGLYASILRFLLKARLFFGASSTKRMLSSTVKSADGVTQLLGPVAQQASQIVTISCRIDARTQFSTRLAMLSLSDSHAKSMEWLRQQVRTNDTVMSSIISSMAFNHGETMSRFDKLEESYSEHDRLSILSWLSPIPYRQHHEKAYSEVLEGTGSWFLQDSEYIRWRDCDTSAMLWLHGIPGSGKSKLISIAIHEGLETTEGSPKPLYFYCSRSAAEPERARAEDIMRSLVKQLSTFGTHYDTKTIPQYVVERYRMIKNEDFASGDLPFKECCDFISKFAADHGKVLLMIDGLDECNEDDRHLLIQGLNDIMRSPSTAILKLMISSRDSPYLTTYFEEYQTFEVCVESSRNQQDIDVYVEKQLEQLIMSKRLRLDEAKPPSAKLRQLIVARLCDESQGMFRWVSLQLDYICTLHKASDIRKRLGKLPKSLSNSYQELYDRKYDEYELEDRQRLEIALSLLLVSREPIHPGVFSKLVFWDNEEEDEDEESANGSNEEGRTDTGDDNHSDLDLNSPRNHKAGKMRSHEDSDAYKDESLEPTFQHFHGVTRLCFNLVIFDGAAHVFRFAHTSVQDYLVNYNPAYQKKYASHARVAEHCISILLYTIKSRRCHSAKFPIDKEQIQALEDESRSLKVIQRRDEDTRVGNLGKRPVSCLMDTMSMRSRKYPKVHRDRLDIATLDMHGLPWRWSTRDSNLILVQCPLRRSDLEILSEHTRRVRARRLVEREETQSGIAIVPKHGHEDLESAAKKTQHKQRSPSESSGSPCLQVSDFWYFNTNPINVVSLLERLVDFVDKSWAFYAINSEEHRNRKGFKALEDELQCQFVCQSWEAVRPWIFFSACKYGLIDLVRSWTEAYPRLARTAQGLPFATTALMEMCGSDHSQREIAKILIDNGADSVHVRGLGVENPLCKAAASGDEAIISLLIEKRPELATTLGLTWSSPIAEVLSSNPANALSVVKLLLKHGASANEISDHFYCKRPLHLAAREQNIDVIKLLLDNDAFIDAQDFRGFTLLSYASSFGQMEGCRLLLARGADVNLMTVEGRSLFTCVVSSNVLVAELLLNHGADINARSKLGRSALHEAAHGRRVDIATQLIAWGINVNATDIYGGTALHFASESGTDVTEILVNSGADVNITNIFGNTALSWAVDYGSLETVKLLIDKSQNINQIGLNGETQLSIAASKGDRELVDLLLNSGAQIHPQEPGPHCPFLSPTERVIGYFQDPVLAALGKGHFDVVKMMMEFFGGREDGSQFLEPLCMLDNGDVYGFKRWSAVRFRNLPINQPRMVAIRQEILARARDLVRENARQMAAELGIAYEDPLGESGSDEDDEDVEDEDDEDDEDEDDEE